MLVVAVGGIVCLTFLVVAFAGRFSIFGAQSRSEGTGRFFVFCRPRLVVVGLPERSVSGRVEPFRFRVVVEEGRMVFKKID